VPLYRKLVPSKSKTHIAVQPTVDMWEGRLACSKKTLFRSGPLGGVEGQVWYRGWEVPRVLLLGFT